MSMTESSISKLYRRSSADKPRLRIGLMLDSPQLAASSARIVEDILASNFADVCLVIYNSCGHIADVPASSASHRAVQVLKDKQARRQLLYKGYTAWDGVCADKTGQNPLAVCDYS